MRKNEFLQELRACLNGEVSDAILQENIRYYDDYITQETCKGRSEEEVIDEIGSPRLIARSIIDSTEAGGETGYENPTGYYQEEQTAYGTGTQKYYQVDLNKWYWKLAAILIVVTVILLIVAILGGMLTLVGTILLFIVKYGWPFLLAWWLYQYFRRR